MEAVGRLCARRWDLVGLSLGIVLEGLGVTTHGLRHEALIGEHIAITRLQPLVRFRGNGLLRRREEAVRMAISRLVVTPPADAVAGGLCAERLIGSTTRLA